MSNRLERLEKAYKKYVIKKFLKRSLLVVGSGAVVAAVYTGIVMMRSTPAEVLRSSGTTVAVSAEKSRKLTAASGSSEGVETAVLKPATSAIAEAATATSAAIQTAVSPSYVLAVSPAKVEKAVTRISQHSSVEMKQQESRREHGTALKKPKTTIALQGTPEPKAAPKEFFSSSDRVLPKENYFQEYKDESGIDEWIKKYEHHKSYNIAIYITKYYYDMGVYDKSFSWAKRANQLDRDQEDAWLFYAKSVYALGNSAKAKKILEVYLEYKKSQTVSMLLSEWNR
ncbi:MAG: tetratricopeptide repeat protein [Thiovulaceae bacterium]|nr:tetratricopeptide repeat protein [Sulfurimonadaceae bacterium]